MKRLTGAQREQLLANGRNQRAAIDSGADPLDFTPVVHKPRRDRRLESPEGEPAGRRTGRSA